MPAATVPLDPAAGQSSASLLLRAPTVARLRPDGDLSTGSWLITPLWSKLNEVVIQPTAGNGTTIKDFLSTTAEVSLATVSVPSGVQSVTIWAYSKNTAEIDLRKSGTTTLATTSHNVNAFAWASATYTGNLTQTEIDSFSVQLVGSGADEVDTVYAELSYYPSQEIALGASHGTSDASLVLQVPVPVPLSAAAATSSATLALSAPVVGTVLCSPSVAQSSGALSLTAKPTIALASAGQSNASLSLSAKTTIPLDPSTGSAHAALTFAINAAPTTVAFAPSAGRSSATLALSIPFEDPHTGEGAGRTHGRAGQALTGTTGRSEYRPSGKAT